MTTYIVEVGLTKKYTVSASCEEIAKIKAINEYEHELEYTGIDGHGKVISIKKKVKT